MTRKSPLDYLSLILILGLLLWPENTCNDCERFTHEQGKADMEKAQLAGPGEDAHTELSSEVMAVVLG